MARLFCRKAASAWRCLAINVSSCECRTDKTLVVFDWWSLSETFNLNLENKKFAYLTNMVTAVGVRARSMPFHDLEI